MSFISDISNDLRKFDWNDITDFDSIGVWPGPVKAIIISIVVAGCCAAGYFLHIQKLQESLNTVVVEESTLRSQLEAKALLAANLDEYRAQTEEMERSFAELLRQLPSETEVPGLLDDVTQTGLGSGLEFSNIALADEVSREFYIELPINVDVKGDYHDFGTFVSGVASLGRIVTLHDFEISADENVFLDMSILAKTYRYKSEDDE